MLFYRDKFQVPYYTITSFTSTPYDIVGPQRCPSPCSQIICPTTDCILKAFLCAMRLLGGNTTLPSPPSELC